MLLCSYSLLDFYSHPDRKTFFVCAFYALIVSHILNPNYYVFYCSDFLVMIRPFRFFVSMP